MSPQRRRRLPCHLVVEHCKDRKRRVLGEQFRPSEDDEHEFERVAVASASSMSGAPLTTDQCEETHHQQRPERDIEARSDPRQNNPGTDRSISINAMSICSSRTVDLDFGEARSRLTS